MPYLISPKAAADQIGVGVHVVKAWTRRADDPLPSVVVGDSGKHRKIIADLIDEWLERQATRK